MVFKKTNERDQLMEIVPISFQKSVATKMVLYYPLPPFNNPKQDSLKEDITDFTSIFKCVFLPMRFVAIEMDPFCNFSSRQLFVGRLFALAMVFINTWASIYSTIADTGQMMASNLSSGYDINPPSSTTDLWSMMIDYNSFNIFTIGLHSILLSMAFQSKWKTLWLNLQRLAVESRINDYRHFIGQCRRTVNASIVLFLAVKCRQFHLFDLII